MMKTQMLNVKSVFLKKKYGKRMKKMLAVLLIIAVSMTSLGIENFAPDVHAAPAYTTLYLADDTAEHWIGNDNALIELVDNTDGHDHYVMTRVNDTTWSVRVPESTYNVTFNRLDPSGNTQWNSWSAGGRDGHNTYHAQGHEYGYWDGIEETEAEIIKIYDTDSDFAQGSMQGISGQNGSLVLGNPEYLEQPVVKTYNQEAAEGIAAVETMEPDRTGNHTVHYNITLEGKAERKPEVGDTDAYFRYYEGNLYAFIHTPMYWKDAEAFCEECGGHLATVGSEKENTLLKEMAGENGSGYTALGFSDEGTEGDWKWVTGEPDRYTKWRSGEPNDAYGRGQDHAYMYANGEWDDGYDEIISPFFCEWEMVENPLLPAGRNIELVVEVNGSVEETDQWECQRQEDGSTVMVHFLDAMMPGETAVLDMDITVPEGEGYRSVIKDSYYLYYDRQGKGHRIEMGDFWLPVPDSPWSGIWNVTFDSRQEGTNWGKLCWEAVQAGDSRVTAHIKAYDAAGEITETDVENGQELQGIRGRYAELEMILQAGQDYRSPVLEKVVLESAQVSNPVEITETVPEAELLGQEVMTEGSCITEYFKVAGGLEIIPSDVEWTLVSEKGEAEDYEIRKVKPYLAELTIRKAGIYFLQGMIRYGKEECYAKKKIVVKKAPEIEDMESLEEEGRVNLVLELPDYGKVGEQIHGSIHLASSRRLQSVRVVQDREEIGVSEDGTFEAVLPGQEGKSVFDILAVIEGGGKIQKQKEVIVDDTPPVITITPEKESYVSGERGRFRLEITDTAPIHQVSVFCDGIKLYYGWNQEIETGILLSGEHTIEVTASDLAGNEASGQYTFRVEESGGQEGENPDEFGLRLDRSSAGIGDTVTVQVAMPDNIDPSTLTVMTGEMTILMENNQGIFVPEEAGAYTFVAEAKDGKGEVYHAEAVCMVYDTTDKTAPQIRITSPESGAILTDITEITGSITDDKGLEDYTVEYAPEGTSDFILLAKGKEEKKDGVLGKLDTTLLCNGNYTIKITVKDKGGNVSVIKTPITVEGNLKVGTMQIGFTDITAKMGGTTVSASRMYDSRNKKKGDFGYGWSLGMQGMELSESHSLADGYRMVKSGSLLSTVYQMTETVSHDVMVTYGDGTSDRFELTFTPERQALVPISSVTLGYRCVTNQKVKLEIIGDATAMVSGGELFFEDENMYDTVSYKLTTEEGNEIYIRKETGVYKIADASGNVITVDQNGYHAENGRSVTFTRDQEDRIIKAEDPAGNVISYAYDDAGDLVSVTDAADRRVSFVYDKQHNLVSITDPLGIAVARNEYDEEGRLVATIDADGNRIEYDYDVEGRTQAVKDRRGNTTVYIYDDNGNILQTVDASGNKTTNTYDEYNNLLTTKDAKGNSTSYAYDTSGNVTQVTAADGTQVKSIYTHQNLVSSVQMADKTVMEMEYDNRGRISSVEDANGNETTYSYTTDGKLTGLTDSIGEYQRVTYDSEGNVASTTNGAGESASYCYDKDGRVTSVTVSREENGAVRTFTSHYNYNAAGDITESVDNAGNVTQYEYDANGNQTASVDAKGRRITYEYDDLGNLTKTTYPDGTFETFTYDANGNNVTATDRSGLTVTMSYDKLDRMTGKNYADGTKESYAYDAVGNVAERISTSGAKTTYTYDRRNRNTAITDAYGNVTSFEYDESARLTKRVDAKGNETSYEYDGNGNITRTIYADGNSVTSEYDARNRVIRQEDQNGNETIYTYDGADRLTGVTDAYGNSYTYGYDGNGNLVTVTDAKDQVTRYTYDEMGRVKTVTNALGRSVEYIYDETGNVTQSRDYAGTVTKYTYDSMDRVVKKTVGDAVTEYTYSDTGLLMEVTGSSGTVSYQYDRYNRLTKQTDVNGITLTYAYDEAGRIESFDNGFGRTAYEYDLLDRVTKVIDRNGKATVYEYDESGNRSAVRYPNGSVVTYIYDACQRLKEECVTNGNGVQLSKYSYGIGKAGERTSVTEVNSGVETEITYQYDRLNRLVKETIKRDGNKLTNEYAYDEVSNRTEKKVTVKGDIAELADIGLDGVQVTEGTTTYTYNALNQLVSENSPEGSSVYTYDANGNLIKQTGSKTADYTYDKENRLLRAAIRQGSSVTTESYTYDYEGNRISRTVNGDDTTFYVNDTGAGLTMVVAETDRNGEETAYYTRGDELLSMERDGEACYYLYDGHGSVRILTNEAGRITDRYSYDAYGNLLGKEGDSKNEFLYTGEQYNSNTGLYYLRARYMNPSTGTFISMDSYPGSIYDPVSLHKYLYANANPVMYTDLSGYAASTNLTETIIAATITVMFVSAVAFHDQAMMNIFANLRRNLASSAMLPGCTVTVVDWKNVILGFPAHDFDTKWIVTVPAALLSWRLFEAIYATDKDVQNIPGVPVYEDEKEIINGIPAEEQSGAKVYQNNKDKPSNKPYKNNKEANKQAQKQGYKDAHDLKKDYVGKENVSKFDMKYDTKTGEIYLESKDGKIQIPTGLKNK